MAKPTGEKRKADSDAEDVEEDGPGSPLRQRAAEEDEDLRRITTTLHSTPHHPATTYYNYIQIRDLTLFRKLGNTKCQQWIWVV